MNIKKPIALVILDGWGHSDHHEYNAIYAAHPSTFNFLWKHYPHALLRASGSAVGLPEGVIGNSEVGHMTIGTGTIIEQPLSILNNALNDGSFFSHPPLIDVLTVCKNGNGRLHLIGLLSDGNVHSSQEHVYGILKTAVRMEIQHIFIHVILDGRDVPEQSGFLYLQQLEKVISECHAINQNVSITIGSLSGRYYAMDRDENWKRTYTVYNMLINGKIPERTWQEALENSYNQHIFDQFFKPTLLDHNASLHTDDSIIFFNIRPDRMRQLCALLTNTLLPSDQNTQQPTAQNLPEDLHIATLTTYDNLFNITILFKNPTAPPSLLMHLSEKGYSIFAIAETEKYAHITYFFNGGREAALPNETRVLIPSHKDRTYDMYPEMSAPFITDTVIDSLKKEPCDFYLINYANADMVAHSGNYEKTKQAITCIDHQLERLYITLVEDIGGTLYITADHGNAEEMWDFIHHGPKTAHTTNPVPFIAVQKTLYGENSTELPLTQLADITPFILKNIINK